MLSVAAFPAPLRPARSRRPTGLRLDSIGFFGRSFAEYVEMFALDAAALKRRPVLDVAAGPSSFTAEACRLGIDAVAVDPAYGGRPEMLAAQVEADYQRMQRRIREQPGLFRVEWADDVEAPPAGRAGPATGGPRPRFASLAAAERDRRGAAQRFLDDYRSHVAQGRYFGAALPHLPFLDGAFDVVLCGHLLFLHARQLDEAFHLAACRELVRVSRDEVRIHPTCGSDGRTYPGLARLRDALADDGVDSRLIDLDHEFFIGARRTLVLSRTGR